MNRSKLYFILVFVFVIENAIAFILGRYHTIYGIGIYMLPSIWIYALVAPLIYLIVKRKKYKDLPLAYLVGADVLFLVYFAVFAIDKYKPTITVSIPQDFEGCVYLFHTDEESKDVIIDQNGIGYINQKGSIVEYYWGDERLLDVSFGHNKPMKWNNDSTAYESIIVNCIDLSLDTFDRYYRQHCLDWDEYQQFLELGLVDEKRVRDYSRELEPSELLQRKINKQFRMPWPTNLQKGLAGEMIGKPINEKIYGYLTFKYDTLSSKNVEQCGFRQSFRKGFVYEESACDSIQHVRLRIRKTPLNYTKRLYSTFFQIPGYSFNSDTTKYYPLAGEGRTYLYNVEENNDSVFVDIRYPLF